MTSFFWDIDVFQCFMLPLKVHCWSIGAMLHLHWSLLFWGPSNSYVDNAGLEWCYSSPAKFFRVAFLSLRASYLFEPCFFLLRLQRNKPSLPWRMFCRKVCWKFHPVEIQGQLGAAVQHKFSLCGMFLCSLQLVFFLLTVAKFATFFCCPFGSLVATEDDQGMNIFSWWRMEFFWHTKQHCRDFNSCHIFSIVFLRERASCSSLTKPMLTLNT